MICSENLVSITIYTGPNSNKCNGSKKNWMPSKIKKSKVQPKPTHLTSPWTIDWQLLSKATELL